MLTDTTPLPARDDTLLGVCQGLGDEFGFNPDWLRVALGAGMLWNPLAVIAGYLALGLLLAVARWLMPVRPAAGPVAHVTAPAVAGNDAADALPLAA